MTPFDSRVPFLAWTFLVYLSDYLLIGSVIYLINDFEKFNSFSRASFLTLAMCGTFFLFFPTTYPRPIYPEESNPIISFLMNMVRNLDTPNNCFPSMHVAMTGTAAWCMRWAGPRKFLIYCLWSVGIFISTLTTKQHYVVDILGGVGVTVVVTLIEWVFFQKNFLNVGELSRKLPPLVKANK